jgi:type IV secretion system protein VirD4
MTGSDNQRKAKLFLYTFAAIVLTLLCFCWAVYSFRQATLKTVVVLEPSFSPALAGQGSFLQRCLFDLRYQCSEVFFAKLWQYASTLPLYSVGLSFMVVVWMTRKFKPSPLYDAAWATLGQLTDMWLIVNDAFQAPIRRALLIAILNCRLLGIKPSRLRPELGHVLICGPTRSGKSQHLMCNLINWSGSAVVVDIKGELHRLTSGHRSRFSNVVVLDPSGFGHCYDPFVDIGDSAEALQTAAEVVLQIDRDREPVFAQRGANAVIAARRAAHLLGRPTLPYLYEVTRWGLWHFIKTLRQIEDEQVSASLVRFVGRDVRTMNESDIAEDRFLNSSWSTITSKMTPLLTEGVLKMTSGFAFSAKQLLEQPTTLYLRFNEAELDSSKHILRLTVLALITAILRYKDNNPDNKTVPVLLGLDEAGRVHIPRLDDLVSTVAGRGVSALVYVQDLSQFESTYGIGNAKTIRSNCHTQLFYPPKDLETARYISNACGFQTRPTRSYSKEPGILETRRYTHSESKRELITPDEVRQLSPETVILFAGDKPPIKAKRLTWFKIRWLKKHTQLPPTKVLPIAEVIKPNKVKAEKIKNQQKFVRP